LTLTLSVFSQKPEDTLQINQEVYFNKGVRKELNIKTQDSYIKIKPRSNYIDFNTDRGYFQFNKPLRAGTLGAQDSTLQFQTSDSTRLVIDQSGNIGVGTDNPSAKLHVSGDAVFEKDVTIGSETKPTTLFINGNVAVDTVKLYHSIFLPNKAMTIDFFRPAGTVIPNPDIPNQDDPYYSYAGDSLPDDNPNFQVTQTGEVKTLFTINCDNSGPKIGIGTENPTTNLHVKGSSFFDGYIGIGMPYNVSSRLRVGGDSYFKGDALFTGKIRISTTSWTNNQLHVEGNTFFDGNVGIGTSEPKSNLDVRGNVTIGNIGDYSKVGNYLLAIAGEAIAERVVIKYKNDWPDFVFDKNYKTKSLDEIENFINNNGHLPDVPTANEVKENGIDVGKMNALLLQKIEELTLLMINQNKVIQEQGEMIKKLMNNE